jgi:hypothetical protein
MLCVFPGCDPLLAVCDIWTYICCCQSGATDCRVAGIRPPVICTTGVKRRTCICRDATCSYESGIITSSMRFRTLKMTATCSFETCWNRLPCDEPTYPGMTETSTHLSPNLMTSLSWSCKVRSSNGSHRAQVESDSHRRTLYSPYVKANETVCEFVRCVSHRGG